METSFSHLEEGLSPKLVCLWQGPDVIIKKISDVVYSLQKEEVTAGGGGLQQSETLPRTKEDQPPANAVCNQEQKNRNLIRHQGTSKGI